MYDYNLRLFHAAGDSLIFAEETVGLKTMIQWESGILLPRHDSLGAGHQETKISKAADGDIQTAQVIQHLLNHYRVYHFQDASSTASVRQSCYFGDNRQLMSDAGNLAALLFRFREENSLVYQRIVKTIRLIAPFFDDFDLQPDKSNNIILNWREKESDRIFGPHQFSDGTLRAICLTTLLLQPEDELPALIIVDEPELGLHPYALNVVAAMFGKASYYTQILISTQSSSFLDNFNPEDVIVVNRVGKESEFQRLNPEELTTWLEEYSLGELWEKNAIGGMTTLMIRLYLFAEGQTEQTFADNILKPHLAQYDVFMDKIMVISHARKHGIVHRGGGGKYQPMKNDIIARLKQEKSSNVFFTTMIDLYAIRPEFPGLNESEKLRQSPSKRVEFLEQKFAEDIVAEIGDWRFIPYIQLHEYEAYLFADPTCFESLYNNSSKKVAELQAIADQYETPEFINDSPETSPSKRIISHFPAYKRAKVIDGSQLAERIGLNVIRDKCPHFNRWVSQLESLNRQSTDMLKIN